jgi:HAMP domain-containing protein
MASQGYSDIIESTDYRGEEVLAAFTYIPQTGWGLVAKRDLEEIYAPVRRMLINLIILVLITAAIIYFISRILANSFTKPLINMVKVSNKIQSGDFSVRNKIYNDDEIGYLADSYNKMTDSIESKIRLEQRRAEISNIMIPLLRLKDFNQDIVYKLMEITDSNMGVFYVLNDEKSKFEYVASVGIDATLVKFFDAQCREGEFGKAITSKKISHLKNIPLTIPIVVENQVVAIISLASLKKYEDETLEILNNSFSAINMAFSNLLANEETRRLNKEIKGKNVELQKQTEELHYRNKLKNYSYKQKNCNYKQKNCNHKQKNCKYNPMNYRNRISNWICRKERWKKPID